MKHYDWRGSTDPTDETGTAIFYAHGEQSDALVLPHFRYATEIQRMLDHARREGRWLALQEINAAVTGALNGVTP